MITSELTAVPFLDLAQQHRPLMGEIELAMRRVIERSQFILGEDLRAFEGEFADYCEAQHAVGVASGTSALELLFRAHGLGPGDEVIVPASTFYSSAYAVVAVGARPVFADCDATTGNLDPAATEAALSENTRAILAVHLYGRPADIDGLSAVARKSGALLLEDACQAHGAYYRGRRAGTLGDGAAFSFYPGKNLGAFGDGGMVVTHDAEIAERVRLLRDLGQPAKYRHTVLGTNARLDTIQAAILRVKLPHLDGWNRKREAAADRYRELLADLPLALPPAAPPGEHVYHLFVVRTPERDRVRDALRAHGIEVGMHYPTPLHLLEAFASLGHSVGAFPNAESLATEGLSLPMFPEISDAQQHAVAAALRTSLGA